MSSMSNDRLQCVCAPVSFERPQWGEHYYPDNCPADWRMAYFMNDFPVVYLRPDDWFEQPQMIAALREELEPGFELVLQWPGGVTAQAMEMACQMLLPLQDDIACMVLDVDGQSPSQLDDGLQMLGGKYALNFICPASYRAQMQTLAQRYHANFVWQGEAKAQLWQAGEYQVVRLATQDLREYTPQLQRLQALISDTRRAGIFLEPAAETAQRALELRTVIELMGMA